MDEDEDKNIESCEFTQQEIEEMYCEYEVKSDRERVDSHHSSKSSY